MGAKPVDLMWFMLCVSISHYERSHPEGTGRAVMNHPRFATEEAAQKFFGIDKTRWNSLRKLKLIPAPVSVIGLYDLRALDHAFDRISGLGSAEDALAQWEQQTNEA
jgi:hypothetical protein